MWFGFFIDWTPDITIACDFFRLSSCRPPSTSFVHLEGRLVMSMMREVHDDLLQADIMEAWKPPMTPSDR